MGMQIQETAAPFLQAMVWILSICFLRMNLLRNTYRTKYRVVSGDTWARALIGECIHIIFERQIPII